MNQRILNIAAVTIVALTALWVGGTLLYGRLNAPPVKPELVGFEARIGKPPPPTPPGAMRAPALTPPPATPDGDESAPQVPAP